MRKVLLVAVNAKYIHSCPAVYSLRASSGHAEVVQIAEFTINDRYQDILAGILAYHADIIGFSCYIWNTQIVTDLIADIRALLGDKVILYAGGPEASYGPETFLGSCDFVMCGEGEKPFALLMEAVSQDDLEQHGLREFVRTLPGAAWKDGGRIVYNPINPEAGSDMNKIPFLYTDLGNFDNRIIYYESSRGCPFRCTYCLSSIDKTVRFRDLETVKRELQFFIDHKVPQVKFVDRTFNC
ncbi:MAG: cobalamin-dependent protein, partial [Lachnospiraceae bacterium]|nr:cobalamin-dependent protein [Lachnospiraceae bacterium]